MSSRPGAEAAYASRAFETLSICRHSPKSCLWKTKGWMNQYATRHYCMILSKPSEVAYRFTSRYPRLPQSRLTHAFDATDMLTCFSAKLTRNDVFGPADSSAVSPSEDTRAGYETIS